VGIVLVAAPAAAEAACRQEAEITIARNSRAEVVGRASGTFYEGVYACLGSSEDRIEVEHETGPEVERLKLRGTFVAYVTSEQLGEEYSRNLAVRDLRQREGPPGNAPGYTVDQGDVSVDYPQSPEGPFVGRFGLRPNGSVAFTVWHAGRWRVARWRPGMDDPVVLDGHRGIDPSFLKLHRDRVRWRRRGVVHFARVP
jgi:hypothetical protein